MTKKDFIGKVVNELIKDDFSVSIKNTRSVGNNFGGWFDSTKREMVVAMGSNIGFEILLHEYCHYLQWKRRLEYFNNLISGVSIFFNWLDGKFYSKNVVSSAMNDTIELEWDCEKLAIKTIKKYNLDVNVIKYCRNTNAYLLFYHMARGVRKWTKNGTPYDDKISKTMDNFIHPLDYYLNIDNISEKQVKIYKGILNQ